MESHELRAVLSELSHEELLESLVSEYENREHPWGTSRLKVCGMDIRTIISLRRLYQFFNSRPVTVENVKAFTDRLRFASARGVSLAQL